MPMPGQAGTDNITASSPAAPCVFPNTATLPTHRRLVTPVWPVMRIESDRIGGWPESHGERDYGFGPLCVCCGGGGGVCGGAPCAPLCVPVRRLRRHGGDRRGCLKSRLQLEARERGPGRNALFSARSGPVPAHERQNAERFRLRGLFEFTQVGILGAGMPGAGRSLTSSSNW